MHYIFQGIYSVFSGMATISGFAQGLAKVFYSAGVCTMQVDCNVAVIYFETLLMLCL